MDTDGASQEPKVLNLNSEEVITESFLLMAGGIIKYIMRSVFGGSGSPIPVKIKGTKQQVDAFGRTIASEKKYMDSFYKHGLHDERTYKTKLALDRAVKGFERATRIKWPFKQ